MIKTFRPDQVSQEAKLAEFRRRSRPAVARAWADLNRACGTPDARVPFGGPGAAQLVATIATLGASVTKNTFTTAATIIGDQDRGPFSVEYFNSTLCSWEIEAMGIVSTTGTPTLQFLVKAASTLAGLTMIAQAPASATATLSGLANVDWYLKVIGKTAAAAGTASTFLATGVMLGLIWSSTVLQTFAKNATPPTAVTVDLTAGNVFVDLQAAWGTSSISNTITTNFYSLQASAS